MKVVMKNDINKVSFLSLIIGDVFIYNNILFMKIETSYNATNTIAYNAVRLVDGKITDFLNEYVTPIDGKFIMD